ncbi:MAG: glucose-6-phosphate isomerase [Bacteroidales bacterium]|jgi:glucose-6-phosphate isomerase|nr:glucose-6-phosphate isomerase [Bacteroidales bacterium]
MEIKFECNETSVHFEQCLQQMQHIHEQLIQGTGSGNEYLGWMDLPANSSEIISDINQTAAALQRRCDVFVVIGIGGSYLGAKAVIEALSNHFNQIREDRQSPLIIYAGNNLSEDYIADLLHVLDKKDYCLAVISKSGTTTEPAIAFRILREHIQAKYGQEAKERIIAITDKSKGALKSLADSLGYKTFIVPDNVGGRFSVLTPVGLLPIAVAGFDISKLMNGALAMRDQLLRACNDNPAWQYAAMRNALLQNGKAIEMLVSYEPRLTCFSEWWKQLFGESEGKDGKGIFPVSAIYTTDLHSLGQYVQEGVRHLFETVIHVESSASSVAIPYDNDDKDGLNYLCNKSISTINHKAEEGTRLAHINGDVPQITITIDAINEETIGGLIYFFEFSCALSGYLLGVNPFNQPGVEAYKQNMFHLLGRNLI